MLLLLLSFGYFAPVEILKKLPNKKQLRKCACCVRYSLQKKMLRNV